MVYALKKGDIVRCVVRGDLYEDAVGVELPVVGDAFLTFNSGDIRDLCDEGKVYKGASVKARIRDLGDGTIPPTLEYIETLET